jgi:hypothetical protein
MELEITWPRVFRLWWAYIWRTILVTLVALLLGGLVGAILGAVMGAAGVPIQTIQLVATFVGAAIGLAASVFPMKMILGKTYGEFRLVLVSSDRSTIEGGGVQSFR